MDQRIIDVLLCILNIDLVQIVYSNSSNKDVCQKVKVRPILIKDALNFQASEYRGQKVFHENFTEDTILSYLTEGVQRDVTFRQIVAETKTETITMLISKKGTAVPFLVDLGVMTKEGKIVQSKYNKYRQINRFLEFIEDVLPSLPKEEPVTILDFGCGKS